MSRVQQSGFARAYSPRIAGGLSLLLLGLCAVILFASQAFAQSLSGRANVVDGDTLIIGDTRIRLNAIDAPETDQTCLDAKSTPFACGIVARDRLRQKIGNSTVSCTSEGEDRYGRTLALCRLGNEDLNRWLIAEGLALAYVQYSDRYSDIEKNARRNKVGLWAGTFTAPWDWRHRTPNTALLGAAATQADRTTLGSISPSAPPVADCTIKGNVNRQGDRIYFLPGNSAYGKVRMDKGLGERWFCSEEEALSAGWRKARNNR
jgi:endonuclease YncB( thermonuclease family)